MFVVFQHVIDAEETHTEEISTNESGIIVDHLKCSTLTFSTVSTDYSTESIESLSDTDLLSQSTVNYVNKSIRTINTLNHFIQ